jgi:hypothetical protein
MHFAKVDNLRRDTSLETEPVEISATKNSQDYFIGGQDVEAKIMHQDRQVPREGEFDITCASLSMWHLAYTKISSNIWNQVGEQESTARQKVKHLTVSNLIVVQVMIRVLKESSRLNKHVPVTCRPGSSDLLDVRCLDNCTVLIGQWLGVTMHWQCFSCPKDVNMQVQHSTWLPIQPNPTLRGKMGIYQWPTATKNLHPMHNAAIESQGRWGASVAWTTECQHGT